MPISAWALNIAGLEPLLSSSPYTKPQTSHWVHTFMQLQFLCYNYGNLSIFLTCWQIYSQSCKAYFPEPGFVITVMRFCHKGAEADKHSFWLVCFENLTKHSRHYFFLRFLSSCAIQSQAQLKDTASAALMQHMSVKAQTICTRWFVISVH